MEYYYFSIAARAEQQEQRGAADPARFNLSPAQFERVFSAAVAAEGRQRAPAGRAATDRSQNREESPQKNGTKSVTASAGHEIHGSLQRVLALGSFQMQSGFVDFLFMFAFSLYYRYFRNGEHAGLIYFRV